MVNKNQPNEFLATDFGAVGDGKSDNTIALQKGLSACRQGLLEGQAGGGILTIPPGIYLTGPLELFSRTTLNLQAGAVIQASPNLEDYPPEPDSFSMESNRPGLITARDAETVTICGLGVIDGNGLAFMDTAHFHLGGDLEQRYTRQGEQYLDPAGIQHGPFAHGDRPGNLLRFYNCRNVLISEVTIQNSPTWTTHINHCDQVDILGVKINSRGSDFKVGNDDGIDLVQSTRVHIANCDIQTGDDCIALFGSQMVTVSNCTLSARSAGVRVGFDDGDTRDCVFNNLVINSNRGLNVNVRGEGSVANILFTNIIMHTSLITGHWWGKAEPIHVSAMPWNPKARKLGQIRNVVFRNIIAESESGILIYGCPQSYIQNLTLDDIHLHIHNSPLQASYGGNFDLRSTDDKATALFKHDIPGLYAGHFDGLTLRNIELTWDEDLPDFFTNALVCEHFKRLTIDDFQGTSARPGGHPAIVLVDGETKSISGVSTGWVSR